MWVDKYKPTRSGELLGQGRHVARIKSWLKNFNSDSKPLFIYGPPGIGKTTAAQLCCTEMGYKFLEFNASDQRNKSAISDIIGTLSTNSRLNFFGRASETKDAIILDEVDGMAGNEDRGGIAQLIQEIKTAKKPIIFICNDGQDQKLRGLKEKCDVIQFNKPDYDIVRSLVSKISAGENLKNVNVKNLAEASDFDMRQIINSLSLFREGHSESTKTRNLTPFEATKKALQHAKFMDERFECFFSDYGIMPLFMFENYHKTNQMSAIHKAADSMCLGDLIEKEIRTNQNWSLLNTQALFSTVIPSKICVTPSFNGVNFPSFLGKLSSNNRRQRLAQELGSHICLTSRGSPDPEYLEALTSKLVASLVHDSKLGGPDPTVEMMCNYSLLRSDFDSLQELAAWSFKPVPKIETKAKTAFTNRYKKQSVALPYMAEEDEVVKPKRVYKSEVEPPAKKTAAKKETKATAKGASKATTKGGSKTTKAKAAKVVEIDDDDDDDDDFIAEVVEVKKKEIKSETKTETKVPEKRPPKNGIAHFFTAKKQKSS